MLDHVCAGIVRGASNRGIEASAGEVLLAGHTHEALRGTKTLRFIKR